MAMLIAALFWILAVVALLLLIGDWRDSEPRVVRAVHVARWTVGVLVLLLILGGLLVAIANPI